MSSFLKRKWLFGEEYSPTPSQDLANFFPDVFTLATRY